MSASSSPSISLDFIAAGGNRFPAAADWARRLLAFGTGNNIALWNPDDIRRNGIHFMLSGHTDLVTAVKIYDDLEGVSIISGSADNTVRIWTTSGPGEHEFHQIICLYDHSGSINTISVLPNRQIFITGAADGTARIWHFQGLKTNLVQTLFLKPRYLPLASSLAVLDHDVVVLAVAGTSTAVQLFVRTSTASMFCLQATLNGHQGWIRSLDFWQDDKRGKKETLLASASQDKLVRLWKLTSGHKTSMRDLPDAPASMKKGPLANKPHRIGNADHEFFVSFEALLIGHEDWIYTVRWAPKSVDGNSGRLLTSSADNSLALWSADETSGLWTCETRLGGMSAQKGATTATGSTGGFWIGLWHPDTSSVVSLGRTGSWRKWLFDNVHDNWTQEPAVSGHTDTVRDLSWAPDGSYLLTTSTDQTTRVFAEWSVCTGVSWHEMARPQIHGYDLNCIDAITQDRFISGADEKLLRVFDKSKQVGDLLSSLGGHVTSSTNSLPDSAGIPVLGLSNKVVASIDSDEGNEISSTTVEGQSRDFQRSVVDEKYKLSLQHPPVEDDLARYTLWPEHEKLYGHGYEISALAASHDGSLVATACKASSLQHAVIRMYGTKDWREIRPSLLAHTLTITALAFSSKDNRLLSVGRDRQWTVFERETSISAYTKLAANPRGHNRMILDCSFAPGDAEDVFATAGRDRCVKVWRLCGKLVDHQASIASTAPVTAVSFLPMVSGSLHMAYGTEDGNVHIVTLDVSSLHVNCTFTIGSINPSKAITKLRWRPKVPSAMMKANEIAQLAIASEDFSLRIVSFGR